MSHPEKVGNPLVQQESDGTWPLRVSFPSRGCDFPEPCEVNMGNLYVEMWKWADRHAYVQSACVYIYIHNYIYIYICVCVCVYWIHRDIYIYRYIYSIEKYTSTWRCPCVEDFTNDTVILKEIGTAPSGHWGPRHPLNGVAVHSLQETQRNQEISARLGSAAGRRVKEKHTLAGLYTCIYIHS